VCVCVCVCVLQARQLHTAASYLRILQNIAGLLLSHSFVISTYNISRAGIGPSRRAALQLLQLALDRNEVELAGDLARFLEPVCTRYIARSQPTVCAQVVAPDANGDDMLQMRDDDDELDGAGRRGGAKIDPDADDDEFFTQVHVR
jgi:hypothetical protein